MPEVNCICKTCGKPFFASKKRIELKTVKYCSRKCAGIGRGKLLSGKNHPNWKNSTIICNCNVCGKEFKTTKSRIKNGRGKYCSRKCSDIGRKTGKEINCKNCNKQIYSHLKSNKQFCNKKCQSEWIIKENRKNLISRPVNPVLDGSTNEIILTRNKIAIIDSAYYNYINQFNWYTSVQGNDCRAVRRDGNKIILMSRDITNAPNGKLVDHINHNTLDNRLSNLRLCNEHENGCNRQIGKSNKSGYKGVSWSKGMKKWRVRVASKQFGYFDNIIEAAKEYDKYAKQIFGDFAYLNFPLASIADATKDLNLSRTTIVRYKPAGDCNEA